MHKDWCGKQCSECQNPCYLDESIPCSPDCECLGENGETDCEECRRCDAISQDKEFAVRISYNGVIYVSAKSEEAARERVCELSGADMHELSEGIWRIDEIEESDP